MSQKKPAAAAKLKVALYVPWIYQKGGIERTFLELISRSRHDWTIFTNRFEPQQTFPEYSNIKVVELSKVSLKRDFIDLARAGATMLGQKMDLSKFDVFLVATSGFSEFVTMRNAGIPTVAFCFTPLRVIHDPEIRRKYLAEHRGPARAIPYHVFSKVYRLFEKASWKKFKFVIMQSREAASRVIKAGLFPKNQLRYLKFGIDCARCKQEKSERYFLLPGRITWTKNVELGLKAFVQMKKDHPELEGFRLVVAGGVDEKSRGYADGLEKTYARNDIEFIEGPADKKLFDLYAKSWAVLFTAINEDWGLVPIEGMACGKPVVATNQGGPKESMVDKKTGFLAEPVPDAFAQKMAMLAKDRALCARMGKAGMKRAAQYDWKQSARQMDGFLAQAAGKTR